MAKMKKVEVCANCSGFDVNELKGKVKAKIGCIGKCSRKCPELNGKVYGFLNGEFAVCNNKEDFFSKIDELGSYAADSKMNPLVDAFLSHVDKWKEEFEKLRIIVLDSPLTEELKWGQPCYTFQNSNIVILGGFKDYIALSFFKGALLADESGILVRQTENIQEVRQIRFTNAEEIDRLEAVIKTYIQEAIEVGKAGSGRSAKSAELLDHATGLKVITEKKPELIIPEELINKFNGNTALKIAFENLTPGRQRGYIFYFNGAKQSKTRAARIEKCIQQILDGKGLDD